MRRLFIALLLLECSVNAQSTKDTVVNTLGQIFQQQQQQEAQQQQPQAQQQPQQQAQQEWMAIQKVFARIQAMASNHPISPDRIKDLSRMLASYCQLNPARCR